MTDHQQSPDETYEFVIRKGTVVSHYKIVDRLGTGGMGEVFLAEDIQLGRQVVLKFLHPQFLSDEQFKARFKREAKAAAIFDHPNIITIHEVDEFYGRPFIAMQYINGVTLSDYLGSREHSLNSLIILAIQICDGLKKAHMSQVTHRDIKPSNVLIDADGRAKLLDFGLATILGDKHITRSDATMGTPHYMSPEQAQGKAVDHRSDLFSFGSMLYEMLAGKTPFARDNLVATAQAVVSESPQPLSRYRSGIPDELQRIITKLLQKNPDMRYQHADDVIVDLRNALKAIEHKETATGEFPRQHRPSIAVLPFKNLSSEQEQDYFCEGIAEEIINALTHVHGLLVASRSSSFVYKEQNEDIRDIGKKLNVETVLEGSVRKAGSHLRITTQLIEVATGFHLWSERFDREVEDLFAIQDEIAHNITRVMQVILSEEEKEKLTKLPTVSIKAYDFYLRGRQFFHQRRRKSLDYARQMFSRAIEEDPHFSLAYSSLADCCSSLVHYYGDSSGATIEQGDHASSKALELDPQSSEAHAARGFALWIMGREEEAYTEFEKAIAIEPKNLDAHYFYGRARYQAGDLIQAAHLFDEACRIRENHEARYFAAQTYSALQRHAEAETAYRRAVEAVKEHLELNPDDSRAVTMGAVSLCRLGDCEEGLRWGERAMALDPDDGGVRYNVACLYALEGLVDRALDCLESAFQSGFGNMEWIKNDPDLDSLRNNPRFTALVREKK